MLKVVIFPIALTLFFLCLSIESFAQCSCSKPDPTAVEEYDGASAVLIGEILTIQDGKPDPDHRYIYTQTVTVRVERSWKKDLPSTVTLKNRIDGCINGWKAGDRHLIYAHANEDGATYSNGCCCSRTKRLDRVDGDMEAFAQAGYQESKVIGQEDTPTTDKRKWTEVDLTVNGIRSGTPYSTIVNKIGKPTRERSIGRDECGEGGRMKNLIYPGLTIGVLSDPRGRNYEVISIEVTSDKWSISPGIRIGAERKSILQTFGKSVNDDALTSDRIDYVTRDNMGLVNFSFQNGKLVRASMQETLC